MSNNISTCSSLNSWWRVWSEFSRVICEQDFWTQIHLIDGSKTTFSWFHIHDSIKLRQALGYDNVHLLGVAVLVFSKLNKLFQTIVSDYFRYLPYCISGVWFSLHHYYSYHPPHRNMEPELNLSLSKKKSRKNPFYIWVPSFFCKRCLEKEVISELKLQPVSLWGDTAFWAQVVMVVLQGMSCNILRFKCFRWDLKWWQSATVSHEVPCSRNFHIGVFFIRILYLLFFSYNPWSTPHVW